MKLTNIELKRLQELLNDITQNIGYNMDTIDDEIAIEFIHPIMKVAVEISDKIFIQTKDNLNEVNL